MYLLGYSLDNLSLMALTLSVGFVVDDAIVMLENIVRHMEMGKPPMRGGVRRLEGDRLHDLSMTLSLAAVFIPVLFMGGIVGRLLHEFAVTIGVAILVSGFVSISLTPMLCSRFLKPPHTQKHGRLYNATERMFDALAARSTTGRCAPSLRFRAVTMAVSLALLVGTGLPVHAWSQGLPAERGSGPLQHQHRRRCRASASTRWSRHQHEVADDRRARIPNVAGFSSNVGGGPGGGGAEHRAASAST